MQKVAQQIVIVLIMVKLISASLDPACFPGCHTTTSWSDCVPNTRSLGTRPFGIKIIGRYVTCILCSVQIQQHVLHSSQTNSTCLPNNMYVAVRGFSFGLLSAQKLRLPRQATAHSLALVECGITDIEGFALATFIELHMLNLDFNHLTHVKQKWFNALKFPEFFKSLSLSHNNISSIDSNCFQQLINLNVLLLDFNSLQSIGPSWFYKLESLGHLSLKSNLIQSIHPGAFKSLLQLVHLDLSGNALNHLPSETVKGLHKLEILKVSGNKLLSVGVSVPLVMKWSVHHKKSRYSEHRIAVTVKEVLFCITQEHEMRKYHVQMQHDFSPELALQHLDLTMGKCNFLNLGTTSKTEYDLPLVMIFIDSEPDKQVKNLTDFCKHAWYDAGSVNVALDQGASLRIGPICADKPTNKSLNVAVVLYDTTAGEHDNYTDSYSKNVTTGFFREEQKNVTCFVNTARGETFRHVFTSLLSDTPEGNSCGEQKKTEQKEIDQQETEQQETEQKEFPEVTRNPKIGNQTIPYTTRTVTAQPGKRSSPPVRLIALLAVVGVALVAMLPTCFSMRKKGYCSRGKHAAKVARSRGNQAAQVARSSVGSPLSIASVNHWMIGGGNSRAVTVNIRQGMPGSDSVSYSQRVSYSGDEQGLQYSEIPDEYYCNNRYENTDTFNMYENTDTFNRYENKDTSLPETSTTYWQIPEDYFNYYNTRPASLHHYWEIGDDYYNYENTAGRPLSFPLALQVPLSSGHDDDEVYPVSLNASAADAALPTVNRLRCKPSSYGTATRVTAVTQNYGVRARNADISSYGTPASVRRIALLGRYGRTQRGLCSRDKAMVFYDNPSTAHACAAREQTNLMYKASCKIQPRYQNIPCPQYANMPIARSKDYACMTNDIDKEGQIRVHRSKTFSMKVPKSRMEEALNKARYRRKSI